MGALIISDPLSLTFAFGFLLRTYLTMSYHYNNYLPPSRYKVYPQVSVADNPALFLRRSLRLRSTYSNNNDYVR